MSAVEEAVVEVAGETVDTLEHARPWKLNLNGTSRGQQIAILTGVFLVGAAVGSELTFKWTKNRLEFKYEQLAQQEIESAKEYYKDLSARVQNKPATPEEMLAKLHGENPTDKAVSAAVEAHASYLGAEVPAEKEIVEDTDGTIHAVESEKPSNPTSNIFDQYTEPSHEDLEDGWNYEVELRIREENPNQPYVISVDEFNEGEMDYDTSELTYFEGDDTLADDKSVAIPDTDGVVGDDNLVKFGHGSKDQNRVYIRNDRLQLDFEVVRSNGKYTVEVLGLDDPDEIRHSQRPGKFRGYDD